MKFLNIRFVLIHLRSPAAAPPPPLLLLRSYSAAAASSSSSSSPSLSSRRHHYHHIEEESSRNVKVSVWWDFENCSIPSGANVFLVATRITSALRSSGIKGPVTINAFGDVAQLSRATQEALTSTGVCLTHVPHSGKNSSDRSFMADLVYWVSLNPPPVHFFLISADRDFANILHRLRMSNYNILLASTETAPSVLCSAATLMWPWSSLVKGESLTTKHFNHPPDGLYSSWYGYFKGALDDPFSDIEQVIVANSQTEKSMELLSEVKPRPVPRALVNAMRRVLHSYPEGLILSEFRAELKRNNVTIDKDLYGYKKFSHFLSSMPAILRLVPHPTGEGQPLVIGTHKRVSEAADSSSRLVKEAENPEREKSHASADSEKPAQVIPPVTSKPSVSTENVVDACTSTTVMKGNGAGSSEELIEKTNKVESKGTDADADVHDSVSQRSEKAVGKGLMKRLWRSLNGSLISSIEGKTDKKPYMDPLHHDNSIEGKRTLHKEKPLEKENHENKAAIHCLRSSELKKDETSGSSEQQNGFLDVEMSFSNQIANWWRCWVLGKREDNSLPVEEVSVNIKTDACGESDKVFTHASIYSENHDLFSKSHFWDALESFLLTSKGSEVILKSRTREQLVHGLRQEGPQILKDLDEIHLLQLINLLVEEKKWLEFTASHTFPFKLSLPDKQKSVRSHRNGANGLSSLFTGGMLNKHNGISDAKPPQNFKDLRSWFEKMYNSIDDVEPEEFQKLFENKFGRKLVSSTYGFPDIGSLVACITDNTFNKGRRKVPLKREEVLSDCHKHLTKLFEEYPDGFNMSIFRPTFMQKYGYVLDHQMLGYPKLASLLQIMPGVRIESSYVIPSQMFQSGFSLEKPTISEADTLVTEDDKAEVSGENGGENNSEEAWDELGPLNDTIAQSDANHSEDMERGVIFDEASLSDEDLSDTDGDTPISDGSENERKKCEPDSSLLQILDSWYSSKESSDKAETKAVDGLVDCSECNTKKKGDHNLVDQKLKVRQSRRYSFVSESREGEKEKLVESILGSLKKAGDARLNTSNAFEQ